MIKCGKTTREMLGRAHLSLRGGKVTGRRETGRRETGRTETRRKEMGGKTNGSKERDVGETVAKESGGGRRRKLRRWD